MKLHSYPALVALVLTGLATPALADETDGSYSGPYIAVSGGLSAHDNHSNDGVVFDTNRDGIYARPQDKNYDFHSFRAVLGFRF